MPIKEGPWCLDLYLYVRAGLSNIKNLRLEVDQTGPEEDEEVTEGDRENFLGSVSGGGLRVREVRIFSRDSSLFFFFS